MPAQIGRDTLRPAERLEEATQGGGLRDTSELAAIVTPQAPMGQKLSSYMYDHITTLIFDVDGTLTHDGHITPALLPRLQALHARGLRLALCTARSLAEGVDFITRELGATVTPDGLFNGGLVLEDGHVWLPPGASDLAQVAVVTRPEAHAEMEAFRAAFRAAWQLSDDPAFATRGWGTVIGVDEPLVQEIPAEWATLGSVSIWKESRSAGWPHYRGEHDGFTDWALAVADRLALRHTVMAETGAATLRVLERGLNKGTALERLGFGLGRAIFIGDGLNDIPVVEVMRAHGGTVMAVAKRHRADPRCRRGGFRPAGERGRGRAARAPGSRAIVKLARPCLLLRNTASCLQHTCTAPTG